MASALGQIPKISRSRSGVLLLRRSCQTQIKIYAGAFSRSFAKCRSRLIPKSDAIQFVDEALVRPLERLRHQVVRRVVVPVVGVTVLLIGIALLVLVGPAFVVIPVGLAILAMEYAWARRWLKKARRIASDVVSGREPAAMLDLG